MGTVMSFDLSFDIACGTITGRSHALAGKPNQDAHAVRWSGPALVAVVCDGCGSGARSEVGAALGARLVTASALARIEAGAPADAPDLWDGVRADVLAELGRLARAMGGRLSETVSEYLLFTIVGLAVGNGRACVLSLGDGLFAVDGEITRLGPFARNEPPYLAYGLLPGRDGEARFTLHRSLSANAFDTALLGTDGAIDLADSTAHRLPGSDEGETVGPLSQLWSEDSYFNNRDALRRRLARINRDAVRPIWSERRIAREAGLLEDDTTLVVLRRRAGR